EAAQHGAFGFERHDRGFGFSRRYRQFFREKSYRCRPSEHEAAAQQFDNRLFTGPDPASAARGCRKVRRETNGSVNRLELWYALGRDPKTSGAMSFTRDGSGALRCGELF